MSEDRVFVKCAWRLVPFMAALYFVNFLDRTNVAFAALTMNRDLNLSPSVYGFGAGLFFVGYFLCEVPSNVVLARVGARLWIFRIMATWGVVAAACAFIEGPVSLYVLRFLLGVAEAGFYPGMLLYVTYWFPRQYRARFFAGFIAAAPLATVFGGPISGFVLDMNGLMGLKGWQWLFLLEGAPAFFLSFAVLKWLPNGPQDARWLSTDEKQIIASRLAGEDTAQHRGIGQALRNPRVIALALSLFGVGFARFGVGLWLPLIVQGTGFSNFATGFVVALPYLLAVAAMILWGRSSDSSGERTLHVALPMFVAAAGLITASLIESDRVLLVALACAVVCIEAIQGPYWSLPTTFLGGPGAAAAIGLIAATGQLGAFLGASIMGVLKQSTGDYALGLVVLAIGQIVSASVVLGIGRATAVRPEKIAVAE